MSNYIHNPIFNSDFVFKNREGLSSGNGATPSASHSSRSDPAQNPQTLPQAKEFIQPRVYYLPARTSNTNSPRQQKVIQQQRTKLSSSSGRSGNGSRQHHRSSPRSANNHHYYINPAHHHRVPPEARSLTTDTSFHSDSFYPDWSAHPHHIRLPYPSPESSFDQLWFNSSSRRSIRIVAALRLKFSTHPPTRWSTLAALVVSIDRWTGSCDTEVTYVKLC